MYNSRMQLESYGGIGPARIEPFDFRPWVEKLAWRMNHIPSTDGRIFFDSLEEPVLARFGSLVGESLLNSDLISVMFVKVGISERRSQTRIDSFSLVNGLVEDVVSLLQVRMGKVPKIDDLVGLLYVDDECLYNQGAIKRGRLDGEVLDNSIIANLMKIRMMELEKILKRGDFRGLLC